MPTFSITHTKNLSVRNGSMTISKIKPSRYFEIIQLIRLG